MNPAAKRAGRHFRQINGWMQTQEAEQPVKGQRWVVIDSGVARP